MILEQLRTLIRTKKLAEEHSLVSELIAEPCLDEETRQGVVESARELVHACRDDVEGTGLLDSFLMEFGLSNSEGVGLMCLAEALLRIPDATTADRLIAEKILSGDWISHLGNSESLFVNASTWGLMLTGRIVQLDSTITQQPGHWLKRLTATIGEPMVRAAIHQAMKIMGGQYVLGRDIEEGMSRGKQKKPTSENFSFDMLGEAAHTEEDARRYFKSYSDAIDVIGAANAEVTVHAANGISVKLSALHPRYDFSHKQLIMAELLPRIIKLCAKAKKYNMGLSIDAEEAARLDLSLDIFHALATNPDLANWQGLGFVLQAYQKRAPLVAQWLTELANQTKRKLMVRLVKGAYWDAEIKLAQEQGLKDYPVFTRKANTDICYLHCAKILLDADDRVFPQFATHNAYTAAFLLEVAGDKQFEFQRLHGMGQLLHKHLANKCPERKIPLRIYAPIGKHQDLLPYLVRRLLENGANSSFVNRFLDKKLPVDKLVQDVYQLASAAPAYCHSKIPRPIDIFNAEQKPRINSRGKDLDCAIESVELVEKIKTVAKSKYQAGSIIDGVVLLEGDTALIQNPANITDEVGTVIYANEEIMEQALTSAQYGQKNWEETMPAQRAEILNRTADLLEKNIDMLIGVIVKEAGRTIPDGVSEVREAVDFCRYYANQAEQVFTENSELKACGIFLCISPWNFPLAIFVGQIAAALAAGNAVIAKPADQTPLIANRAVQLFHQAGLPVSVLQLVIAEGSKIGKVFLPDPRISGVCFTGSTDTAKIINQQLALRPGQAIPLIAETGGQNCMVVDSSALPEQVVTDVIDSAFKSAGQRCSALRVLFLQEEIADEVLSMLEGAMQCIIVGDPSDLATDVGPVIDNNSRQILQEHADQISKRSRLSASVPVQDELEKGFFFVPRLFEIESLDQLKEEVFGPVLHVIRYPSSGLNNVIAQINDTNYGLTLGVHSRIQAFADYVFQKTRVGNIYINRNMIGAVVGVNPFGGTNLSGTGPKAGGPNYIYRFSYPKGRGIGAEAPEYVINIAEQLKSLGPVSQKIIQNALKAYHVFKQQSGEQRIEILKHIAADNFNLNSNLGSFFGTLENLLIEKLDQPRLLPGPTGEQNLLYTQGKGPVICLVTDVDSYQQVIAQITMAIATGCPVIVVASSSQQAEINEYLNTLTEQDLVINLIQVSELTNLSALVNDQRIYAVTVNAGKYNFTEIKKLLAARPGPIIPLVELPEGFYQASAETLYALLTQTMLEKTKTENLVARGGNTQLFNLQD